MPVDGTDEPAGVRQEELDARTAKHVPSRRNFLAVAGASGLAAASLLVAPERVRAQAASRNVGQVGTVAELRGLDHTGLAEGDVVAVLGYHAANDEAGLRFYRLRKNASSLTENGGTVIAPDGTPDRWEILWDGSALNVCWFGAKADYNASTGSGTDNQPFFEKAKTALDATKGGTLFVPVGAYAFATTWNIRADVRLRVVGLGAMVSSESKNVLRGSTLVWTGPSTGDLVQVNPAAATSGDVRHSGPHFENINFVSHASQTGRAVYIRATTGSRFRDCVVRDFDVGLEFDSQEQAHGGAIPSGDAAWSVVDGLHEYDCNRGINVPHSAGIRVVNGKFMHRSVAGQWAIYVASGPQVVIAHNKFDRTNATSGGGIYNGGQFNQILGNNFEDTAPAVRVGAGPHADDGFGTIVANNRFRNLAGEVSVHITSVVPAGGTNKVRNTTVMGNVYKGGGTEVANAGTGTYRREASAPNG